MNKVVAFVLNNSFVPGFKATMNSILEHTENFCESIICLSVDLNDDTKAECLDTYPNITFCSIMKANYKRLPSHARPLRGAFYKLDLFKLAQKYDRTLFIDSDIIFVKSIQPLLDTPVTSEMMLCKHGKVYNTGLMLIRKLNPGIYNWMIGNMRVRKRAWLADQTIITAAIDNKKIKISKLHSKWNTTKRQLLAQPDLDYCGLHFVGNKPWKGGETGYDHIEAIWQKYSS